MPFANGFSDLSPIFCGNMDVDAIRLDHEERDKLGNSGQVTKRK